ncbi:MAG: 4-hydroxythreonine-4-phosphate dehydrogenase PdxA [Deltaproteobacteria bacterium]|nr:4-hydroxythreonine-4-phosphate dehydrogenase PdxA [Deltaproteobacteria bacterium]
MTPRLGITLGDPAGVGPEIVVKALARPDVRAACRPVVIGDRETLRETATRLGERLALEILDEAKLAAEPRGAAALLPVSTLGARARRPGRPTIEGGRASYQYVEAAARLAMAGAVDAIVTAPINKAWVTRAGFPISGHTELLRELTGAPEVRMMLAGERLRVVLVTMHLALAAVPRALDVRKVTRTILIADEHLRRYHRLPQPRLAVAGLNPHAGEGGLFGSEEAKIIAPAVRRACRTGVRASGPYPADSLFFRAVSGEFDAVIAMYHDQGLIPLKLLHFHDGVNVTMGLPILRTSPDHGTAYDIAGTGAADPGSMAAAILLAARMVDAATPARRPTRARLAGARRRQAR